MRSKPAAPVGYTTGIHANVRCSQGLPSMAEIDPIDLQKCDVEPLREGNQSNDYSSKQKYITNARQKFQTISILLVQGGRVSFFALDYQKKRINSKKNYM